MAHSSMMWGALTGTTALLRCYCVQWELVTSGRTRGENKDQALQALYGRLSTGDFILQAAKNKGKPTLLKGLEENKIKVRNTS